MRFFFFPLLPTKQNKPQHSSDVGLENCSLVWGAGSTVHETLRLIQSKFVASSCGLAPSQFSLLFCQLWKSIWGFTHHLKVHSSSTPLRCQLKGQPPFCPLPHLSQAKGWGHPYAGGPGRLSSLPAGVELHGALLPSSACRPPALPAAQGGSAGLWQL